MDPVLNETEEKIRNALAHLQKELASIRAGRANPTLIEELPVNVYGAKMKLMELGTITAPQTTLLTVQVWDASIIKDVEKAIMEANLGLNPSIDGQTIRLPIPPLSEERREEFVKLANLKGEECKVEIRQIRQSQREDFEEDKENGNIGEDELHKLQDQLQNLIDKSTASIDEYIKNKETELRQI